MKSTWMWLWRGVRKVGSPVVGLTVLGLAALYAVAGSLPAGLLVEGLVFAEITAAVVLASWWIGTKADRSCWWRTLRWAGVAGLVGGAVAVNMVGWMLAHHWLSGGRWFQEYRNLRIYQLPGLEMSLPEFFWGWPVQVLAVVLMSNLILVTLQRVRWERANLGVFLAHGGSVLVITGGLIYAWTRVEGDVVLVRRDLGGPAVTEMYERDRAALYFFGADGQLRVSLTLPELPRYSDDINGQPGRLNIRLEEDADFVRVFGGRLRGRVRDFVACGELVRGEDGGQEIHVWPRSHRNLPTEGFSPLALMGVELETDVHGEGGKTGLWRTRLWLTYMRYPMFPDDYHRPEAVDVPGIGRLYIAFSRARRVLPFTMQLERLEVRWQTGGRTPTDFRAVLRVFGRDQSVVPAGAGQEILISLNRPARIQGIKLNQMEWDAAGSREAEQEPRYIIVGLSQARGLELVWVGGWLAMAGVGWAFYVKPVLVRRSQMPGMGQGVVAGWSGADTRAQG